MNYLQYQASPTITMPLTLDFRVALKIAVVTFAFNVLCQAYHVFVEPYQLYVAYSPNPFFIITFLFTQVIFHVKWLADLWYYEPAEKMIERRTSLMPRSALRPALGRVHSYDYEATRSMAEKEAAEVDWRNKLESVQMEYLPVYTLGNLCLGGWSVAWFKERYVLCQVLCTVTILAQFYSLFFIFRAHRNRDFHQRDYLTRVVIKPRAAGAVLLMFKTWGAVDNLPPPSMALQICFGSILVILTLASGPDPTLGICLVYDLIALVFGNYRNADWHATFWWLACVVGIVTCCDWLSIPRHGDMRATGKQGPNDMWGEKSNFHPVVKAF